jgi:hypothetical protein
MISYPDNPKEAVKNITDMTIQRSLDHYFELER